MMNGLQRGMAGVLFFFLLLYVTPASAYSLPAPAKGKLVEVTGGGFVATTGFPEKTVYNLSLKAKEPSEKNCFFEIEFQNPCDKKQPIVISRTVSLKEAKLYFESPFFNIDCVKEAALYTIQIKVYDSENKTALLDSLTQQIRALSITILKAQAHRQPTNN